jgi:alkylhydroperoxidase family enzyme
LGITPDEVERVTLGPDAIGWSPLEAALLRAADELHETSTVSDATWSIIAENYDTAQLIELPMLVGHYHLVAMTLNTLGVELDDGLSGFSR